MLTGVDTLCAIRQGVGSTHMTDTKMIITMVTLSENLDTQASVLAIDSAIGRTLNIKIAHTLLNSDRAPSLGPML